MTLDKIRKILPQQIAEEICSVQPMSKDVQDAYKIIYENENGYRPVSNLGLMWIKDGKGEE